ncbi:MAG: serine phosphatase RsbU (regulator of sigma subunit) [Parvicellaceae bacterium]|jgi:serine phosphatase RsbU (regulator of sigma subunit)
MRTLVIFFYLLILIGSVSAKTEKIQSGDSIQLILASEINDTLKVQALIDWDDIIYLSDSKLDFKLNWIIDSLSQQNLKKKLKESETNFFQNSSSFSSTNLGNIYMSLGKYEEAMKHHVQSFNMEKYLEDKRGMGVSKANMGMISKKIGRYDEAAEYYFQALKLYEDSEYEQGIATLYYNLGNLYTEINDFESALKNYWRGLTSFESTDNQRGVAAAYSSLATVYSEQGRSDSALILDFESLRIRQSLDDKSGIAHSYRNIGSKYINTLAYDSAIFYLQKGIKLSRKFDDPEGEAAGLGYLGLAYLKSGSKLKSAKTLEEAYRIASKMHFINEEQRASKYLAQSYKELGKYDLALQSFENFISIRDSLDSEANTKAVIRQEYKYQYEKQADSVTIEQLKKDELYLAEEKRKEDLTDKENEKKNLVIAFGAGGLGLVLLFTFFIVNRLRITRKQKNIIETQKEEVEQQKSVVERAHEQLEEKNTEIMDSIAYAKRIQSAILPPTKLVKEYLSESFILYKPKDVVAGDFYWMEPIDGKVIFAAADCTGHGVPGAMVSVICNNGLNRSVREYGLADPGQILDKTREIVIQEFEKSEEEVKDGMDISLCSLDGLKLEYAGANNPLWIIRNDEIIETKANKQPIGKYTDPKPFTTHSIELQKGDTIYIFSDGYVDQFGGEKGKKFKPANLRKLLLSIQDQSMETQKQLLDQAFETWRGDLEQIDDVCMIGVRV